MKRCLCNGQEDAARRKSKEIDRELMRSVYDFKNTIRILLLGTGESGKSTILKQMKILYIDKHLLRTQCEINEKVQEIRENVHESIYNIVKQMTNLRIKYQFEQNYDFADGIIEMGKLYTGRLDEHYVNAIKSLWTDPGVKKCYERKNEFQLLDNAKYFLDQVDHVMAVGYVPTLDDILYSRKVTTNIIELRFYVQQTRVKRQHYMMIDVGGQRGFRNKWVQAFEGTNAVLFIISCAEFDQNLRESENTNRLKESLRVFQQIWRNRYLQQTSMVVFLNKQDILKEKIKEGKKIENYFPEYASYQIEPSEMDPNIPPKFNRARCFIKHKLVEITKVKVINPTNANLTDVFRESYFHYTVATDTNNIRTVFYACQDMVFSNNLKKFGIM